MFRTGECYIDKSPFNLEAELLDDLTCVACEATYPSFFLLHIHVAEHVTNPCRHIVFQQQPAHGGV